MREKEATGFLSRWSQRKRSVEAEEINSAIEIAKADDQADAVGLATQSAQEVVDTEPTAEELEMQANIEAAEAVDLETLKYESDFEVFLKKGVPEALKNAAMKKLWRSNPMLAVLDGLNDYDEDYGDPKFNIYKSVWNVGRGFLTEDEANHDPTARAKAALKKLLDDEPEKIAGAAVAEQPLEEELEPTVEIEQETASLPVTEPKGSGNEEDVPEIATKRVSLRSRLFEQNENDA